MSADRSFTLEELGELRDLIEIEKIRKKKQLFSHLLDSLQLERWAELFADDAVAEWGPLGDWVGRAGIYNRVKGSTADRIPYYSMHMTTNVWIELTGPTTAKSCSYLHDVNNDLSPRINPIKMLGVYEELWEKIAGDWQIKHQRFQHLWPERGPDEAFPRLMRPPG